MILENKIEISTRVCGLIMMGFTMALGWLTCFRQADQLIENRS